MLDYLSYLWWRITHRGPGLPVDEPRPYKLTADGYWYRGAGLFTCSELIPYGRGSEFISG